MKYSDETLMAYADGELGEPERGELERALQSDPELAARVAQHRALRAGVFGAFAGVLDEPVPARLRVVAASAAPASAAPASAGTDKVVHLDRARAARQAAPERPRWSWAQWGGMAASLAIGVLAGSLGLKSMQDEPQLAALTTSNGALVAQGQLEHALSQQLASAGTSGGAVRIGVSFVDKGGNFCRSFQLGTSAGLACRDGQQWQVPLLAEGEAGAGGAYRQAGSAMPAAVLDAIDARIAGQALDAGAERAALRRAWARAGAAQP
jgi:hypothetical protein